MIDATIPLPESITAERALLHYSLYENQACQIVEHHPWLTPEMFKLPAHQEIWKATRELVELGDRTDGVAVTAHLGIENIARYGINNAFADISDASVRGGHSGSPSPFARMIRSQFQRREALSQIYLLQKAFMGDGSTEKALESASQVIFSLQNQINGTKPVELHTSKQIMPSVIENVQAMCIRTGSIIGGLATGFTSLDSITGGLKPGTLNIIGGRPGMGKSALVANIAENVAMGYGDWQGYDQSPKPVIFVTLEMTETEIVQRMALSKGKINSRHVRSEVTTSGGMNRFKAATSALATTNLRYIDAPRLSIASLTTQLRRELAKSTVSLVVIDYLQLITAQSSKDQRYLAIGEITRGLKALAKEFKIPFIVGAQLGRPEKGSVVHLPKASDLRESGDIEQDADMVCLLHRPAMFADKQELADYTNDSFYCDDMNGNRVELAYLIIDKHRGGERGKLSLGWEGSYTRFLSLTNKLD